MRFSARNTAVKDIKKGATTSHVVIDVGGKRITASITSEAVEDLKLSADQKCERRDQGVRRHGHGRLTVLTRGGTGQSRTCAPL
jgi:molybdopterin-binding protein